MVILEPQNRPQEASKEDKKLHREKKREKRRIEEHQKRQKDFLVTIVVDLEPPQGRPRDLQEPQRGTTRAGRLANSSASFPGPPCLAHVPVQGPEVDHLSCRRRWRLGDGCLQDTIRGQAPGVPAGGHGGFAGFVGGA